jgi:hypothetical protein
LSIQRVLLRVNQEYIASASQDDQYRTEPPFKLQGSYRNMNKLAEKVVSAMNDEELERLIDDHYQGEAQTLTKGAEQNLLKLAELRGRLTPEQSARWAEVKEAFVRVQRMGGKTDDPVARLTGSLAGLDEQLKGIRRTIEQASGGDRGRAATEQLAAALSALGRPRIEVELSSPAGGVEAVARRLEVFERQVLPLVSALSQAGGGARGGDGLGTELEAIRETLASLHELVERGGAGVRRIDVAVSESSPTHLFRLLSSDDVCTGGGVFVATYEKPPPLGTPVLLSLTLPRSPPCEVRGTVLWVQDEIGEHAPPGFGVRFVDVPEGARGAIRSFSRLREPLLRDD